MIIIMGYCSGKDFVLINGDRETNNTFHIFIFIFIFLSQSKILDSSILVYLTISFSTISSTANSTIVGMCNSRQRNPRWSPKCRSPQTCDFVFRWTHTRSNLELQRGHSHLLFSRSPFYIYIVIPFLPFTIYPRWKQYNNANHPLASSTNSMWFNLSLSYFYETNPDRKMHEWSILREYILSTFWFDIKYGDSLQYMLSLFISALINIRNIGKKIFMQK